MTMTSSELQQNPRQALKAAAMGPVTITDQGRPTSVLMRFTDYQELVGSETAASQVAGAVKLGRT